MDSSYGVNILCRITKMVASKNRQEMFYGMNGSYNDVATEPDFAGDFRDFSSNLVGFI